MRSFLKFVGITVGVAIGLLAFYVVVAAGSHQQYADLTYTLFGTKLSISFNAIGVFLIIGALVALAFHNDGIDETPP